MLLTLIVSASCVSYSQLNLGENWIGPEGAKSLADALKVNASLTQVLAFCQHPLTHPSEHSLLRCLR